MKLLSLFFALVAVSPSTAAAAPCECGGTASPCAQYSASAAVFVGRVESVRRLAGSRLVTFSVVEGFRGVVSSAVDVRTGPAGEACALSFRPGREYVVYASRADGDERLSIGACSRTREAQDAASDLTHARAMSAGLYPTGRIAGQAVVKRRDLSGRSAPGGAPLAGLAVTVIKDGAAVETTVTNQAGDFGVENRGGGAYAVSAEPPERYYTDESAKRFELSDSRACADVDLVLYENGRVRGRVTDATGRFVPGMTVELATLPSTERRRTITDREGRFELTRVPPGRYLLRAGTLPIPPLATRVVVAAGEPAPPVDLRLPREARYVALSGFVLDADGLPAEGARVYLRGAGENDRILSEPARTDFLGRFVIAAAAGAEYSVFAEQTVSRRVESSDQLMVRAVEGSSMVTLTLRKRY